MKRLWDKARPMLTSRTRSAFALLR
jgi:hypothetical protein